MRSKTLLYAAAVLSGVLVVSWAAGLRSEVAAMRKEMARMKAAAETRVELSAKDLRLARAERLRLARDAAALNPVSSRSTTAEQLQQARNRIAELEGLVSELSEEWTQFSEEEQSRRAAAVLEEWNAQQVNATQENPSDGAR